MTFELEDQWFHILNNMTDFCANTVRHISVLKQYGWFLWVNIRYRNCTYFSFTIFHLYIFIMYRISPVHISLCPVSHLYIFLYVPYFAYTNVSWTVSYLYIFLFVPYFTCTYFLCTVSHLYIFLMYRISPVHISLCPW